MGMEFGTSGPLKRVPRESAKYKLDSVGMQVRWERVAGTEPEDDGRLEKTVWGGATKFVLFTKYY
jgi:hypothetical protein